MLHADFICMKKSLDPPDRLPRQRAVDPTLKSGVTGIQKVFNRVIGTNFENSSIKCIGNKINWKRMSLKIEDKAG